MSKIYFLNTHRRHRTTVFLHTLLFRCTVNKHARRIVRLYSRILPRQNESCRGKNEGGLVGSGARFHIYAMASPLKYAKIRADSLPPPAHPPSDTCIALPKPKKGGYLEQLAKPTTGGALDSTYWTAERPCSI